LSVVPTTTGSAQAVEEVIPELKGKLNAIALRIPTPVVSLCDIVVEVEKSTTVKEVNQIFKEAADKELRGILDYTEVPLVSIDYRKNPHSGIVDGLFTMVIEKNLIKIIAWYDNEWGYSTRLAEFVKYVGEKI